MNRFPTARWEKFSYMNSTIWHVFIIFGKKSSDSIFKVSFFCRWCPVVLSSCVSVFPYFPLNRGSQLRHYSWEIPPGLPFLQLSSPPTLCVFVELLVSLPLLVLLVSCIGAAVRSSLFPLHLPPAHLSVHWSPEWYYLQLVTQTQPVTNTWGKSADFELANYNDDQQFKKLNIADISWLKQKMCSESENIWRSLQFHQTHFSYEVDYQGLKGARR